MPTLADLPSELRQHILLLALPDSVPIAPLRPREACALLGVCRRLRADMLGWVLRNWTPARSVYSPGDLRAYRAQYERLMREVREQEQRKRASTAGPDDAGERSGGSSGADDDGTGWLWWRPPPVTTVRIHMFDCARDRVLRGLELEAEGEELFTHYLLLDEWMDAAHLLPRAPPPRFGEALDRDLPVIDEEKEALVRTSAETVTTVVFDATPAPSYVARGPHRRWLGLYVGDRRAHHLFLPQHRHAVSVLMARVVSHLNGVPEAGWGLIQDVGGALNMRSPGSKTAGVRVELQGTFALTSRNFVNQLVRSGRSHGIVVHPPPPDAFVPAVAPEDCDFFSTVGDACDTLFHEVGVDASLPPERVAAVHVLLKGTLWRDGTDRVFRRNVVVEPDETMQYFRMTVHFAADDSRRILAFEPAPSAQRELLHELALDLGFHTFSTGDEPHRFVTMEKVDWRRDRRPPHEGV